MRLVRRLLRGLRRLVLAAALLYVSAAIGVCLVRLPVPLHTTHVLLPLVGGFGVGLLVFAAGWHFLALYVFGHELTHLLAAKLFGRRTGRFRVGTDRGSVEVEKPNIWIILAPYFVPLYSLIWIGLWGIAGLFTETDRMPLCAVLHAGTGVTYAFHLCLTAFALAKGQQDLKEHGPILSMALILFCNLTLVYTAAAIGGRQLVEAPQLLVHQLVHQTQIIVGLWN